jgi:DNA-binding MarR family transcriptional regulator
MLASAPWQAALPTWLPENACLYLAHVLGRTPMRVLARRMGCHASTVQRRVRAFELRRDDPLVDEAIAAFEALPHRDFHSQSLAKEPAMTAPLRQTNVLRPDEAILAREARRVLRRLCENGAVLAVAPDLDKAAVLKGTVRIAVLERTVAQAFALNDWIAVRSSGRVTIYEITPAGRAALKRMLDTARPTPGLAEASAPFADQHREWADRSVADTDTGQTRRLRYNLAESPFAALARRRDKDGQLFLTPDLVAAGERLREDFELAQMGPRVAQNWDRFLTAGDRGVFQPDAGGGEGSSRARARVAAALRDLGPGLGDMALRCCCFLEGLEVAEKRMGWSARSGKIVLRIALAQLKRHYEEAYGGHPPLIG